MRIAAQAVLLAIFFAAMVWLSIRFGPAITRLFRRPEETRRYLLSYGLAAPLVYILLHMIQVVIAFIPGELVQIAGGYVFGTPLGTLYSVIGVAAGTLIAFVVARAVGFSLVKSLVPGKTLERFEFLANSRHSELIIFLLFLVPGIPKDALTYIAGLTPIKTFKFLLISMLARFPGLLGSAYIGANLQRRRYGPALVLSIAALVLFVLGVVFREKILDLVKLRARGGARDGKSD